MANSAVTPTAFYADLAPSYVIADTPAGFGSTNNRIRKWGTVTQVGSAITKASNPSVTGEAFTVNVNGIYTFVLSDRTSTADQLGFSLNSTQLTTDIRSITASHILTLSTFSAGGAINTVSWTGKLNAGDVVRPHSSDGNLSGTDAYLKCFACFVAKTT
jgi:hypothetical protein